MARTYAREDYKAYEFYYRSWVEVAEELEFTKLAYALRTAKPYRPELRDDRDRIDAWFARAVVPVLREERDMVLRKRQDRI